MQDYVEMLSKMFCVSLSYTFFNVILLFSILTILRSLLVFSFLCHPVAAGRN